MDAEPQRDPSSSSSSSSGAIDLTSSPAVVVTAVRRTGALSSAVRLCEEPRGPQNDAVLALLQDAVGANGDHHDPAWVRGCKVRFYEQRTAYSCSYVSLMMLTSALLSIEEPCYRDELFQRFGAVPDVVSIQRLLKLAWDAGFDEEGRDHFGGHIERKSVRIGPSDICALLRANRVPVRVFDFDYGVDSFPSVRHFLDQWFRRESGSVIFPVIMGDANHTILVVGVTKDALVVLDPAVKCRDAVQTLERKSLKRFLLKSWPSRQFQVLVVGPDEEEHPSWLLDENSHFKYGGKLLLATRPPRVSSLDLTKRHKSDHECY